jgi:hypothetical protein
MKKVNVRGAGQLKPTTVKKVRNFGGSYYILLPKPFCKKHDIKAGTEMALIMGHELRVTPINKGE